MELDSDASRAAVLTCLAFVDGFSALCWMISAGLDDEPFETESEFAGVILGMIALIAAGLGLAAGSFLAHSKLVWFPLTMVKAFYMLGTLAICFYMLVKKHKKIDENWGYLMVGLLAVSASVVHLMYALQVLARPTSKRMPQLRGQQEMMHLQQNWQAAAAPPLVLQQAQAAHQRSSQYSGGMAVGGMGIQHHHHHMSITIQQPAGLSPMMPMAARPLR
eukprot:TRINITY_DN56422_c0_g1_i1.p1 TRINITY_DN56422_c0_g1~~TRINITY_DN56422_c0_g1_i1.p1  ORF type:complete len:229 (-),score=41.70 TRINITY_DN56422_c0_g1_i1:25-681(-)